MANIEEKRALARQLLLKKAKDIKIKSALSYGQESMYFFYEMDRDNTAYNTGICLKIAGGLNISAFKKSLETIQSRHDILRTVYRKEEDQLIQEVKVIDDLPFKTENLNGISAKEQRALIATDFKTPFDLQEGPIWRNYIYQTGEQEYVYAMVIHHIVFDEWSSNIFMQELISNYRTLNEGHTIKKSEKPTQYIDFVKAQKQDENFEKEYSYWKKCLNNIDELRLNLKGDHREINGDTVPGSATFRHTLSSGLVEATRDYCSKNKLTMFSFLVSVFQLLLHRHSAKKRFAIGTPMAGRNNSDYHDVLGYFVNLIPLVCEVNPSQSLQHFISQNKKSIAGHLMHQNYPFHKMVADFSAFRVEGEFPIFNVVFSYLNQRDIERKISGLTKDLLDFELYPLPVQEDAFDLTFEFQERASNIEVVIKYNARLFSRAFIETLTGNLSELTDIILKDDSLPVFSTLNQSYSVSGALPENLPESIMECFEAQVAGQPDKIAVIHDKNNITYSELAHKVSKLSNALADLPPGSPIGISTGRSTDFVIGVLAVIRSGGFYIPLDNGLPEDRFNKYVEKAGIKLILSDESNFERICSFNTPAKVIALKDALENNAPDSEPRYNPYAYALFTSGSTGTPKLVQIKQESIINLVKDPDYIQINPSQTIGQLSSTSFDASVFEIFGSLLNGAGLAIIPKNDILDAAKIISKIKSKDFDILWLNSSLFNSLIEIDPSFVSAPDEILFGGEAASAKHIKDVLPYMGNTLLKHIYGPTENTVFSTCHFVKQNSNYGTSIPIGKAIRGTNISITDAEDNILPYYSVGEIVLSGVGLSPGYLSGNASGGFRAFNGENAYATGDYAYMKPDKEIVFIGRKDNQIKIRGHRIDLSEIESHIYKTGMAQNAVVFAHGAENNRVLAACIEKVPGQSVTSRMLIDVLSKTLPPFMVPHQIRFSDKLKLTINGKVDRIYARSLFESSDKGETVLPTTETEKILIKMWSEALSLNEAAISTSGNFFELGGHSLLGMKLISQINKEFKVEVEVSSIFSSPTIAALAKYIDQKKSQEMSKASSMVRVSREEYKI